MQSSLWYWWLSHFVAFLANVPWPGCSLICNRNIKSIVSPSREAVANLIKSTLSLGWKNCYKPQTIQRCPGQRVGTCPHAHTSHVRYVFHKMFLIFLLGKGVRLKCWSYHTNEPGISFPFNTRLLLTFSTSPRSCDICGRKTDELEGTSPGQSGRLWGCWGGHYFYFSNQIHIRTTHFRDHVYFAESHTLNTGSFVEGKWLRVQPCLCSK